MTAILWGIVVAAACLMVVTLVALLSATFAYLLDGEKVQESPLGATSVQESESPR